LIKFLLQRNGEIGGLLECKKKYLCQLVSAGANMISTALDELQQLSLVSRVCTELDNHLGKSYRIS